MPLTAMYEVVCEVRCAVMEEADVMQYCQRLKSTLEMRLVKCQLIKMNDYGLLLIAGSHYGVRASYVTTARQCE